MKKRLLSLLLALVMLVGMIPATSLTAFAAAADSVWVGGVEMTNGTYLANGAASTTNTKPSGGYAYYKDGTLTLNNYSYEGKGYLYNSSKGWYATVYAEHDLTLELVGTNTLTQTVRKCDGIRVGEEYSKDLEKLTIQGDGSLNVTSTFCGILAWGSITVNGGTIVCTCTYDGMCTYNQDIIINGGNVTVSGSEMYGLRAAKGSVVINGGYVTVIGGRRAISCGSSGSFTAAEGMNIQASTTVDGELGEYVAANLESYKKIVIEPDAGNVLLGDVNLDGAIDAKDLTLLARHVAKIEYITDPQALVNADINKDSGISSEDLTKLARHVAKIEYIVQ